MSTPITSFQVVVGKLLSKLIQIILLLAISLPLMAIIRIFGGVPWGYLISSLFITLTAAVLAGSVSLFFSIISRRAYVVIVLTILTFLLYLLAWSLLVRMFDVPRRAGQVRSPVAAIFCLNANAALARSTRAMMNPRMAGRGIVWVASHCTMMLAASAGVLLASVQLVRKVAVAQAVGGPGIFERLRRVRPEISAPRPATANSTGRIRRVTGPPVVWKELISRRSSREKIFVMTIIGTELAMIAAIYVFPYVASVSGLDEANAAYIGIFTGVGVLSVLVFPATCITSEKEARSWPLLLTTTVTDWEIVFGKFVGVLRRSFPVWVMLVLYRYPFSGILGMLDAIALALGTTVFFCGTGLYVSARLRQTSTAVAANFVLGGLVWAEVHLLLALKAQKFQNLDGQSLIDRFWATIPLVQAMEPINFRRDYSGEPIFYWLCYILIGILFAWRAKSRFRRDAFHHVL